MKTGLWENDITYRAVLWFGFLFFSFKKKYAPSQVWCPIPVITVTQRW
jgi:hypothetical protein